MFRLHLLSRGRAPLTADTFDGWDAPASELGLDTGAAPVESADPAAGAAASDDRPALEVDESAAAGAEGAEGHADEADDEDQDQDPLDLLTSRDDDDQTGQAGRTLEDRYKALSKRSRKLEKSLKKSLPVQQALREAGVDLRTLLNRHTTLANMEAAIERNPRLRALFNGEEEPPASRRESGRREEAPEVKYPFDTDDEVGRFMSGFHQEFRTQQTALDDRLDRIEKALDNRVGGLERQTATQQRVSVEREWKTAADAAAAKLDKGVQTMFRDAVHSAMQAMMAGRIRATPQQIIDHYLKDLKVSDKTKQTASAAAKQRIAEGNRQLPRRPEAGRGSPASPQSRHVPRMEEFNRGLQRKFGAA